MLARAALPMSDWLKRFNFHVKVAANRFGWLSFVSASVVRSELDAAEGNECKRVQGVGSAEIGQRRAVIGRSECVGTARPGSNVLSRSKDRIRGSLGLKWLLRPGAPCE